MNPDRQFWSGRRVLILGHTGFKGAWLGLWLHRLGAEVAGYSLHPPTVPSLFELADLRALVPTTHGDIRDLNAVVDAMAEWQPDVVFHLAAQSLVRRSYQQPVDTYTTNVIGTVNVLEAVRRVASVRSVVVVTSDKCYANREWPWAYRETDALGGDDPYSSSKACAELVTAAYRRSFLSDPSRRVVGVATTRAGNVIGGGDWAEDRLLPDCMRALSSGSVMEIRNPGAVRPWQHVLEPLCGYLVLAARLHADPVAFSDAWNFGPINGGSQPVSYVADCIVKLWGRGAAWACVGGEALHESGFLRVDASRARNALGWTSRLTIDDALTRTIAWHRGLAEGEAARALTDAQIVRYCAAEAMTS